MKLTFFKALMLFSTSLFASFIPPAFAGTISLAVEPTTSSLAPGQTSGAIDLFLVEQGSTFLADFGLSVATIQIGLDTPPAENPNPAFVHDLAAGPDFLSPGPDPTPGVLTVFSPDPNLLGVRTTTGRLHLGTFRVSLPPTAAPGSPTRFTISAIDEFQFIAPEDFHFLNPANIGNATFEVHAVAVPNPGPTRVASAAIAASLIRRRRRSSAA